MPGFAIFDDRRAGARGAVRRGPPLGRLRDELDEPLVLDRARGRDDDVRGRVHRAVVGPDRAARDGRDHLGGADHRPADRVRAEHGLGDQVVDELLRRVLVHRDLLEHDVALGVEVVEARREDHVAHDRERGLEVVRRHARVDERVLARGRRVQLGAEPVEDLRDLERVVALGALEEQVLDEVRDPGPGVRLVARAGADPVADRDRPHVVELLRDHPLPRVELGQLPVLHAWIVRRAGGGRAFLTGP